jgi:hypothetical protein
MSMIEYFLSVKPNELEDIFENSSLLEKRLFGGPDPHLIETDKAWEGILYILTGCGLADVEEAKPPLKWVIIGDHIVDEGQDMGYGPAEYRTVEEVKEISNALQSISGEQFRQMFDNSGIKTNKDIYPDISWQDDDAFQYYFEYYQKLKDFYLDAEKNGEAVVSFVS